MLALETKNCDYEPDGILQQLTIPKPLTALGEPIFRTLILTQPNITPEEIADFIALPWLANLKKLLIRGRCYNGPAHNKILDCKVVLRALEDHIPRLECFEWSGQQHYGVTDAFNTFQDLRYLRELHIDANMIWSSEAYGPSARLKNVYPASLRSLHLDSILLEFV